MLSKAIVFGIRFSTRGKSASFPVVVHQEALLSESLMALSLQEGNIDTIALALADRCYYYTLYFTAVDPTAYDKAPKKDEINISIYGASGMYDMTKEERLDAMRNMLKDRPVFVRDGDRADTFIISTKQESREKRRQKVLDKLTAEERELLGV